LLEWDLIKESSALSMADLETAFSITSFHQYLKDRTLQSQKRLIPG
jgi:hypothetical protein